MTCTWISVNQFFYMAGRPGGFRNLTIRWMNSRKPGQIYHLSLLKQQREAISVAVARQAETGHLGLECSKDSNSTSIWLSLNVPENRACQALFWKCFLPSSVDWPHVTSHWHSVQCVPICITCLDTRKVVQDKFIKKC